MTIFFNKYFSFLFTNIYNPKYAISKVCKYQPTLESETFASVWPILNVELKKERKRKWMLQIRWWSIFVEMERTGGDVCSVSREWIRIRWFGWSEDEFLCNFMGPPIGYNGSIERAATAPCAVIPDGSFVSGFGGGAGVQCVQSSSDKQQRKSLHSTLTISGSLATISCFPLSHSKPESI